MAPFKFADFTKAANDLINNDFCFDKKFKLKTKTANGVEITTEGAMAAKSQAVSGKLTTKIPLTKEITINKLGVSHDGRLFADAEYQGLYEGLSLNTLVEDGGNKPTVGEVGLAYKNDNLHGELKVDVMNGPTIKDSVSFAYEKFVIGAEANYNTGMDNNGNGSLTDYNVGVGYVESDCVIGVKSKAKFSEFEVGLHHVPGPRFQFGAVYSHGKSKSLTVGGIYKYDAFTSFQGKVNSNGILSVNAHQIISPNVKLIASSEVDAKSLSADSHKFGLQLHLS